MVPAAGRPVTRAPGVVRRSAHATLRRVLGSDGAARRGLVALPWLAYPLAVWAGLALGGARLAGVLVIAALALRSLFAARGTDATLGRLLVPLAAAGLPAAGALWLDDPLWLLFVPVLVSLGLLAAFAFTLWRGPPLIESVARLQEGELSAAEVRYCRGVTAVWCVFFAANAALTAGLAVAGSLAAWALWAGALSYLAIGLVFAVEVTVRAWRFRRYAGGPLDALLRKFFPPRS
jgi:uncharacterized membrane protein